MCGRTTGMMAAKCCILKAPKLLPAVVVCVWVDVKELDELTKSHLDLTADLIDSVLALQEVRRNTLVHPLEALKVRFVHVIQRLVCLSNRVLVHLANQSMNRAKVYESSCIHPKSHEVVTVHDVRYSPVWVPRGEITIELKQGSCR